MPYSFFRLISLGLLLIAISTGCTTESIHQTVDFSEPVRKPVRYPLDYPVCYSKPGVGMIIIPLHIRIHGAGIPYPSRVMALREKGLEAEVCSIDGKSNSPHIVMKDRQGGGPNGWWSLDMTGNGYFSAVSYMAQLLNKEDIDKEAEQEKLSIDSQKKNLIKFGKAQKEIVILDEIKHVNNLQWRHRLIASYTTSDFDHPWSGALTSWMDIYDHHIDNDHILRRVGRYDAMVVADPDWLEARRALTWKLVEVVQIEKITPEMIKFMDLIQRSATCLHEAIKELKSFKKPKALNEAIIAINRLENEGDELYVQAVKQLFTDKRDHIETIALIRIYDYFEESCDSFEDAADIISSIILKNS